MADLSRPVLDASTGLWTCSVRGRRLVDGEWYDAGTHDVEVEIPVHESSGISDPSGTCFFRPLRIQDFSLENVTSSPPYVILEDGRIFDRESTHGDLRAPEEARIAFLHVRVSDLQGPLPHPLLRDIKLVADQTRELLARINTVADALPAASEVVKGIANAMAHWASSDDAVDALNRAIELGERQVMQHYLLPIWSDLSNGGRRIVIAREAYRRSGGSDSDFSTRWHFREAERDLAAANTKLWRPGSVRPT